MCARDMLFAINAFAYTYDPRKPQPTIPFITYQYQDDGFAALLDAYGKYDLLTEKSRDMGLSWMMLTLFWWKWQFHSRQSMMMVSRIEDLVDKKNEPDCLFWKIDFIIEHLPPWLRPTFERQKLSLYNLDNNSSITGASTTSETSRGGRKTAILFDEFAAVPDGHSMLRASIGNTNCRLFNSTPQGTANAFFDLAEGSIKKLRIHWTMHPEKAEGQYVSEYGKARSPWYDLQCQRAAHPQEIAQELDIDYLGSSFQFFDAMSLQNVMQQDVLAPFLTGELDYSETTADPHHFVSLPRGRLLLWTHLEAGCIRPPDDRHYVVGCDVAAGTGASNSVAVVFDRGSREQVAELATSTMRPDQFAKAVVALCRWFKHKGGMPAYLIWEANGPGREFGDAVIETGYRHVYYRKNEQALAKKQSNFPGWYATRETKGKLMGNYRAALTNRTIKVRSRTQVQECREYVFTPTQTIEHARSLTTIDPSGARENHGDRPTAGALCVEAMGVSAYIPVVAKPPVPRGSLADRRDQAKRKRMKAVLW
jgi:hypothetical protein